MKNNIALRVFLVIEFAVALSILATLEMLPDNIATHFNGAGTPNGFMAKSGYLVFILLFSILMPAFVTGSIFLALRIAPNNINIPNKKIWLSPEYKQQTMQYLDQHTPWLGSLMCLFLGYIHWMILNANKVQPPQLPVSEIVPGVSLLLIGILFWVMPVLVKFKQLPKA